MNLSQREQARYVDFCRHLAASCAMQAAIRNAKQAVSSSKILRKPAVALPLFAIRFLETQAAVAKISAKDRAKAAAAAAKLARIKAAAEKARREKYLREDSNIFEHTNDPKMAKYYKPSQEKWLVHPASLLKRSARQF